MSCRLVFVGDEIEGGGADRDGSFTMDGSYNPITQEVALTKRYPELFVIYRGKWDGTMIAGESQIYGGGFYDEGEFELWPEGEEVAMESLEVEQGAFS